MQWQIDSHHFKKTLIKVKDPITPTEKKKLSEWILKWTRSVDKQSTLSIKAHNGLEQKNTGKYYIMQTPKESWTGYMEIRKCALQSKK